jgi:hypothetical protein
MYKTNEEQYFSNQELQWERWVYGALTGNSGMYGLWKSMYNGKGNWNPITGSDSVITNMYLRLGDTAHHNKNHIHIYKDRETHNYMWHLTCGRNHQSEAIKNQTRTVLVRVGDHFIQDSEHILPKFQNLLHTCRQTAHRDGWQPLNQFGGRKKRKKKYNHSSRRKTKRRRKKRRKSRRIRRTRRRRKR